MSEIKSYTHNNEFIDDSLLLLDIILCLKIRRLRINAYSSIDSRDSGTNPPLFISEDEVDTLLKNNNKDTKDEKVDGLKKQIKAMKRMIEEKAGHSSNTFLALPHLAQLFNLSDFELFTVVICLAPELNRKYDKLYAYFQDDMEHLNKDGQKKLIRYFIDYFRKL